jgi:type IV secretory pathway protease TraF
MRLRTTITWQLVLVTALAITATAVSAPVAGARAAAPSPPLYGVTIDRITHIATVVAAEKSLPERPTTRVYFDVSKPASYYASAVPLLHTVSQVMGELLDSSDATSISTSAPVARRGLSQYPGLVGRPLGDRQRGERELDGPVCRWCRQG